MTCTVLVANSAIWPNAAHLARACSKAGYVVDAVAPSEHPVHRMAAPRRTYQYDSWRPRSSLRAAILAARPQIIIPCDDRVVSQLYSLHARGQNSSDEDSSFVVSLIQRSLGSPDAYALLRTRTRLGEIARMSGVRIPAMAEISSYRQLIGWVQRNHFPLVLKLDSSSGGRDVVIIRSEQVLPAGYGAMKLRQSVFRRIKNALWNGDAEPLLCAMRGDPRAISAQSFIAGRSANCAVACWQGQVLASIAVETIAARSDVGVATVVECVEGKAMTDAARAVVKELGLSGMIGLDFIIDNKGDAYLIEINPRATQINHLREGSGEGLVRALCRAASEGPVLEEKANTIRETIALFPQEWLRDPKSSYLRSARHDVPDDEPELLAYFGYQSATCSPALTDFGEAAAGSLRSGDVPGGGLAAVNAYVLQPGRTDGPLHVFPGIGGDAGEVAGLARSFQKGRTVFGMQVNVAPQAAMGFPSVEEIAAQAVRVIRSHQPAGPYRLLGYSFGGLIAFEAAVQLQMLGETVDFAGLIGSPMSQKFWPAGLLLRSIAGRSAAHFAELRHVPIKEALHLLAMRGGRLFILLSKKLGLRFPSRVKPVPHNKRPNPLRAALERYRPGFFAGTLTVIEPKRDKEFHCDMGKLWRRHAGRVEVLKFPSDHFGFVRDAGISALVARAVEGIIKDLERQDRAAGH